MNVTLTIRRVAPHEIELTSLEWPRFVVLLEDSVTLEEVDELRDSVPHLATAADLLLGD